MARRTMFKNLTLREKYILMCKLIYSGKIVETRANRVCVKIIRANTEQFVFLGKAGGVRIADRNAYTASIDVQASWKKQLDRLEVEGSLERLYDAGVLTTE